jgi:hypothetical protein
LWSLKLYCQSTAYGLILERRVADWTLGDRWRIIAAGNRPEDGAISCDLGTAMNDRLVHLVIEPTAQDWLAVHRQLSSYLNN